MLSGARTDSRSVRMAAPDLDQLPTALKRRWSWVPSKNAQGSSKACCAAERRGTKSPAHVVGNHATSTVSMQGDTQGVTSACRCDIGRHGHGPHGEACARAMTSSQAVRPARVPTRRRAANVVAQVFQQHGEYTGESTGVPHDWRDPGTASPGRL
jgi:hypothetical protein